MHELALREDYELLSTAQIESNLDEYRLAQLNRVVSYVMEHYEKTISLSDVADLVAMSESGFSRFFRKATGRRFSDFLNGMRISKACELLSQTNRHVSTICYEVGYHNIANFNRRFYERKGLPPSQYRKQARLNGAT